MKYAGYLLAWDLRIEKELKNKSDQLLMRNVFSIMSTFLSPEGLEVVIGTLVEMLSENEERNSKR